MSDARVRPIITLTTDFGVRDHYVGTMKGVILGRCPGAELVDISHEIPAFSIVAAAYTIDQAAFYFPAGTVHLMVVDPGVGTARRGLCAEAAGQIFVAPDNGVLSLVAGRSGGLRAWELARRDLWLAAPSSTFHGRDIFAPVAAALASGRVRPEDVGLAVEEIELLEDLDARQSEAGVWRARVLSVDRFGNAITNLRASEFSRIAETRFAMEAGGRKVERFHRTFGEAAAGECFAFFGSSGYVELGVNQQSAAEMLGIAAGAAVTLRMES